MKTIIIIMSIILYSNEMFSSDSFIGVSYGFNSYLNPDGDDKNSPFTGIFGFERMTIDGPVMTSIGAIIDPYNLNGHIELKAAFIVPFIPISFGVKYVGTIAPLPAFYNGLGLDVYLVLPIVFKDVGFIRKLFFIGNVSGIAKFPTIGRLKGDYWDKEMLYFKLNIYANFWR